MKVSTNKQMNGQTWLHRLMSGGERIITNIMNATHNYYNMHMLHNIQYTNN